MSTTDRRLSSRIAETVHMFKLSQVREMREITQTELARRMKVAPSSIAGYEASTDPKLGTVARYAEALGGYLLNLVTLPEPDGSWTTYIIRTPADTRRKLPVEFITGRRPSHDERDANHAALMG